MSKQLDWIDLFGRVLLSFLFILSGVQKIPGWDQTADFMADRGLPWVPVLLLFAITIEVVAGLGVLLGYLTRASAVILFLYLIPVTLAIHSFWTYPAGEITVQMQQFLKNLTIMGGLLVLASHGPGRFSVDARIAWRRLGAADEKRPLRAA